MVSTTLFCQYFGDVSGITERSSEKLLASRGSRNSGDHKCGAIFGTIVKNNSIAVTFCDAPQMSALCCLSLPSTKKEVIKSTVNISGGNHC